MRSIKIKQIGLVSLLMFVSNLVSGTYAYIDGVTTNYDGKIGLITRYKSDYGCPDLNGFQDIWFNIIDGKFQIQINNFTSGDYYELRIGTQSLIVLLYDGDNLKVEIEYGEDGNHTYFKGKGASRNNSLQLLNLITLNNSNGMSSLDKKKQLLEIYEKKRKVLEITLLAKPLDKSKIFDSVIVNGIARISIPIKKDKVGYDELYSLITSEYYRNLIWLFREYPEEKSIDSLECFFDYPELKKFVLSIKDINHPYKMDLIGSFVLIHTAKTWMEEFGITITDAKRLNLINTSVAGEGERVLTPLLIDAYYAAFFNPNIKVNNEFKEMMFERYASACANQQYFKYIKNEQKKLEQSLSNSQYKLNDPVRELNSESLVELVNNSKGRALALVFWSRMNIKEVNIPYLEKINSFFKNCRFVYVCLDKSENKDYWAYQIIHNSIPGEHYFFPTNDVDSILIDKICLKKEEFGFITTGDIYFINKKSDFIQLYYSYGLFEDEKYTVDLLKKLDSE